METNEPKFKDVAKLNDTTMLYSNFDKAMDNLIPDSLVEAVKRRYKSILEMNSLEVYAVEEEK